MKRLYSVILFFSFLIGMLQPILPMIEYQLHEGSVVELLSHKNDTAKKDHNDIQITSGQQTSTQSTDNDQELLNDNFYPLGINTVTMPQIIVYPYTNKLFLPPVKTLADLTFLPNPPPPRLS